MLTQVLILSTLAMVVFIIYQHFKMYHKDSHNDSHKDSHNDSHNEYHQKDSYTSAQPPAPFQTYVSQIQPLQTYNHPIPGIDCTGVDGPNACPPSAYWGGYANDIYTGPLFYGTGPYGYPGSYGYPGYRGRNFYHGGNLYGGHHSGGHTGHHESGHTGHHGGRH